MNAFLELVEFIERGADTPSMTRAIIGHLRCVAAEDAAWTLEWLMGSPSFRRVSSARLRQWAGEAAGLPSWLVEESMNAVGDAADVAALLVPTGELAVDPAPAGDKAAILHAVDPSNPPLDVAELGLHRWMTRHLIPAAAEGPAAQRRLLRAVWQGSAPRHRRTIHLMLLGGFQQRHFRRPVLDALSLLSGASLATIQRRWNTDWERSADGFTGLIESPGNREDPAEPRPFEPWGMVEDPVHELGSPSGWCAMWFWGGLRAQCIRRRTGVFWVTADGDLLSGAPPSLDASAMSLPEDTVIEGELLVSDPELPPDAALLERAVRNPRAGGPRFPGGVRVMFLARELLEHQGSDLNPLSRETRRCELGRVLEASTAANPAHGRSGGRNEAPAAPGWHQGELFPAPSPPGQVGSPTPAKEAAADILMAHTMPFATWSEARRLWQQARCHGAQGLLLTPRGDAVTPGGSGPSTRIWPVEPLLCRLAWVAVRRLEGADSERRVECSLAALDGGRWVTVLRVPLDLEGPEGDAMWLHAKAAQIRKTGPVRTLRPERLFEVRFATLRPSPRHRCGFEMMGVGGVRWAPGLAATDATSLEELRKVGLPGKFQEGNLPFRW